MNHRLTAFQEGQLLFAHFMGEFKYKTDAKTWFPRKAFADMVHTLNDGGYVTVSNGVHLTAKGKAYLDRWHQQIAALD